MNVNIRKHMRLKMVVLMAVILVFAISLQTAQASGDPITVVSTIFPLADIVEKVGGPSVRSQSLLPPGASPHTFEPRPGDVRAVATSSLFVSVGAGLDDWAAGMARAADHNLRMLLLSELVVDSDYALGYDEIVIGGVRSTDHHDHDHPFDPHFWLDPLIVRDVLAPEIARQLSEILPEEADAISKRLNDYQQQLTDLDERVRDLLSTIRNNQFIGFHAAWGYYAHRYDLRQAAAVTPFPGQEPSARWLRDLILLARRENVDVVIAEPQLNRQAADTIAKELRGQVIILDPMGGQGVSGRESYIELIEFNTKTLAAALGGI